MVHGPLPTLHLQWCRLHFPCMMVEMQWLYVLPTPGIYSFNLPGLWRLLYHPSVLYCSDTLCFLHRTLLVGGNALDGVMHVSTMPMSARTLQPFANFPNAFLQNAAPLLVSSSVGGPHSKNTDSSCWMMLAVSWRNSDCQMENQVEPQSISIRFCLLPRWAMSIPTQHQVSVIYLASQTSPVVELKYTKLPPDVQAQYFGPIFQPLIVLAQETKIGKVLLDLFHSN